MQRAACDDEMVSLSCARGTSISIQVAQYGKAAPGGHGCIAERPQDMTDVNEKCLWPNAMQYSLLQTVVEACQKKPACKFSTKSKPGAVDPCPHARKFVEVAYKCRPYEFRSRTGCEDDVIKLSCNPYSRVAIFDAQYGRTAYESFNCPQAQGVVDENCVAPYAVETVMQICHGKRSCHIVANSKTFGSPCSPASKAYLKVVYACVPLGVLTERYESPPEKDEITSSKGVDEDEELFDETEDTGVRWDTNPVSPIADSALQPPSQDIHVSLEKERASENTSDSINRTDRPRNENVYFYIGIAVTIFLILLVSLITLRFYNNRKRKRNAKNGNMFTTEAPNIFSDATSDIDNDVSHISGNFYDPGHPDVYRESTKTLRAMKPLSAVYPTAGASMYGVDYIPQMEPLRFETDPEVLMSPKSLSGYTNTQFHYG
ncbi:unnamed protein product [Leptosia nina]|uniref:SUEL-type lectin domain-containing protein n=1 Tax=Leptosia nina TaxID=320188 RepID=A0AAV1JC96_9NEOP